MLVYLAILTPVLLLFCGLVVDVGAIEFKRLQMQSACDAAALGAELEIERGTGKWVAAAQGDAGVNGFTNGSNNVTVSAAMVPSSGAFSGFYDAVQTTISQPQTTAFSAVLGKNAPTVDVRSVAVVPPCVYLMGAKNLTTYELATTAATVNSSTCPYYINGQASVDANTTFSAMAENVTGSASGSAWNDSPSAAPRYLAKVMTDPLASITQPTVGSCTSNGITTTISSNTTVGPGVYCNTTSITCNAGVTLTLSTGLYIIAGNLTLTSCTVNGTGVTFFFAPNGGSYGGFAAKSQLLNGVTVGTTLNLTAPTSTANGGIPGVLFMTDRGWTTSNAQDFLISSSNFKGDGLWYLTGAGLKVDSGTIIGTNYTGVVADNLLLTNATLTSLSNFSNLPGGNPFRPAVSLVE